MENGEQRGHRHRSESSIQFSHSDKFFCKLLEKESVDCTKTNRNPSSTVYYGGLKCTVPFYWETAPGTPKHALSLDNDGAASAVVTPLTPPPRYFNYGSGRESVRRGPRKVLEGFTLRIRSIKTNISHCKYLSQCQWSSALGCKAPCCLRNWRSMYVVPFWTRFGKGREGFLNKTTSFGGCFHS